MAEWTPTEENHRKACAERLLIEKEEPSERRLVDLMAQNDEARARGIVEEEIPLSRWQRYFGYVATFDMARLERWNQERHAQRIAESEAKAPGE